MNEISRNVDNFRRIQWQNMLRMASECISYNLEFPLLYKFRLLLHITVNPPPSYLSAFFISAGVPNGEFPEILIAKCRSRFYCA
jgi:hypothetical protein